MKMEDSKHEELANFSKNNNNKKDLNKNVKNMIKTEFKAD